MNKGWNTGQQPSTTNTPNSIIFCLTPDNFVIYDPFAEVFIVLLTLHVILASWQEKSNDMKLESQFPPCHLYGMGMRITLDFSTIIFLPVSLIING